ncbi:MULTISPECIES: YchJ family metal-binding protein [unclassified Microbacterium]|uniref:YchJ family protein n=1 Tax=unclassified Microbacterium TaxID=2609290 RepID=UPI00214C6945|nr:MULTISPECIES: YchJ family metal-binding protein [unclassified Microbacterium]MCR2785838.1 YchJ family metal-binding protein [Microbacterium sp. zg.B96]WIM17183.1 YchJ family metal-binding protein [Microbacterium sp. zg-B96]
MPDDACPCGLPAALADCCGRYLAGDPAPTAEALMRSRYTAFATGDARYLEQTWHPGTRPEHLDLDPGMRWQGLEIVAADEGDKRAYVEFRARFAEGSTRGVLHERSRFVRQSGRWWYLDGVIDP